VRVTLRYLPALATHAKHLQPLLQDVVSRDRRLRYNGGWPARAKDDQARTLATTALHAIITESQT
jgi:hypothetical protein